jgi:hypothetical protein
MYVMPAVCLLTILSVLDCFEYCCTDDRWLVGGWLLRLGSSGVVDLPLLKSILLFVTRENAYLLDGNLLICEYLDDTSTQGFPSDISLSDHMNSLCAMSMILIAHIDRQTRSLLSHNAVS